MTCCFHGRSFMLGMSFENAIEIYLDWKATHAKSAPDRYAVRLYTLADFVGRNTPLANINGDDIVRYHRHMEKITFKKGGTSKKYSLATVAYSERIVKNFFMFWQGRGESRVNHKEILAVRFIHPTKKITIEEDFRKMSQVLDERYFDDLIKKLAIHLLWDTGMRVSELCDINIADIGNVDPQYGVRTATIRTRKTMRYDLVVWSKETDALLNKYLGIRLCIDAPTDALLIGRKRVDGARITTRTIERWVEHIAELANVDESTTPHSLRHGKAHSMMDKGANLRDIAAVLRHSRPDSSYNYLNLNRTKFLEVASKYLEPNHQYPQKGIALDTKQLYNIG